MDSGLPYGWIGVIAAFQFGMWFYLGIEGTAQAAEECRSPSRSIPLGSLAGIMTLIIAATITWYVSAALLPWQYLGTAVTPLFDAAQLTGSGFLVWLLMLGTMAATLASANGCINDASRGSVRSIPRTARPSAPSCSWFRWRSPSQSCPCCWTTRRCWPP
jgi:ethanolamine permease